MNTPTYQTSDMVRSIEAFLDGMTEDEAERDIATGAVGFWRHLAKNFPHAPKEQVIRAWSIYQDQVRQELEEINAENTDVQAALNLMSRAGVDEGTPYLDALQILAAQGDAEAIRELNHALSDDSMVFMALFEAAVEAHPAWRRASEGQFIREERIGGPTTPESLVDWYQINHGRAASQLETQVRMDWA